MIVRSKIAGIVFFIVGLALINVSAQTLEYQRQYKTAKEFFKGEKYNLAMEAFKPLITYSRENPYSQHASFYYALSAYHQNFSAVAKDMLLQVKSLYPKWDQTNEVDFWLAKIYFDQRQYFQAMRTLKEVEGGKDNSVNQMKEHYLSQIEDVETLRMMLEEYPQDRVVAGSLARAISRLPFLEQDRGLMDSLIVRYNLKRKEFSNSLMPPTVFKEKYVVSLLFPFLAKSLEPTTAPKVNQSVLDLYQGMRMAADTLKGQGINIELRSYDTERSTEATLAILSLDELKGSDLIVGPVFPGQLDLVQEFSVKSRINMINPVSGNSEYIGQNPFALLFPPSYETVGIRSAEWLAAKVPNKNCMVYFGDNAKDSLTAYTFMARARELEMNIVSAQKVDKENSASIFTTLATATEFDEESKAAIQFELKLDSIGSVFVASDDPLIYTKVISGVDTRGDSVIIMGNDTWLNNAAANFETYERLHITMAAPTFFYLNDPEFKFFRAEYLRKHGTMPSEYAKLGYEFIWFVGHALHKYGVYFQEGLSKAGYFPGYMTRGFDFENGRSNGYVPFIHFVNGEVAYIRDEPRK